MRRCYATQADYEARQGTVGGLRWVVPATPENLAAILHGRLAGTFPPTVLASNPPAGVRAFVGVPVFVRVENWTGTVTDSMLPPGCASRCAPSPP